MRKLKNNKGFTLLELLIVAAIMGILIAFAVPRYLEVRRQARINTCVANQKIILRKLRAYRMTNNEVLPTEDQFYSEWLQQNFDDVPSCPLDTRGSLTSYHYHRSFTVPPPRNPVLWCNMRRHQHVESEVK